jgi:glycosyltransferase involved in cell wall biosynthesis
MLSLIIPTYRNPEYLDICLRSAIENQTHKNEIIVAVDGFLEESADILIKNDLILQSLI